MMVTSLLSRKTVINGGCPFTPITLKSGDTIFPENTNLPFCTLALNSSTPVFPFNNFKIVPSGNPSVVPLIRKPSTAFTSFGVFGITVVLVILVFFVLMNFLFFTCAFNIAGVKKNKKKYFIM